MTPDAEELAKMFAVLLSEGLDLCARARGLDEQILRAVEAGMGREFPGATRCATPALWLQKKYDQDLAAWEMRVKSELIKSGFVR